MPAGQQSGGGRGSKGRPKGKGHGGKKGGLALVHPKQCSAAAEPKALLHAALSAVNRLVPCAVEAGRADQVRAALVNGIGRVFDEQAGRYEELRRRREERDSRAIDYFGQAAANAGSGYGPSTKALAAQTAKAPPKTATKPANTVRNPL